MIIIFSFIQPVCLPTEPDEFDLCCGTISGWGVTKPGQRANDRPKKLQVSSISILPNDQCQEYGYKFQVIFKRFLSNI